MRKSLAALCLAAGAIVGYALGGSTGHAQTGSVPFQPGETVIMVMEGGRLEFHCLVTMHRDDFVGCREERGVQRTEVWHNVRFIAQVRRPLR